MDSCSLQTESPAKSISVMEEIPRVDTTRRIVVVGLGYVGLPLAVALGCHQSVIGYDIDVARVEDLANGFDKTGSVNATDLSNPTLTITSDVATIKDSDFYVIVVPTPVTDDKQPDLTALINASRTIGQCLKSGDIVVYESSVYPGTTEGICIPILEQESNLVNGIDFTVGYSPERTNYGDKEHVLSNVVKVISAQDSQTLEVIKQVYGKIIDAGLCETTSIRVAEVAKLVENIQRDVNIALINEIAMIVNAMGLSTAEVLRVAGTKWNFLDFKPGLVGGHCVPVDPHYLIHSATESGCSSKLMRTARNLNDGMHVYVVKQTVQLMVARRVIEQDAHENVRIGIFGLSFKGDCPDIRDSQSLEIYRALENSGFTPLVYDPLADAEQVWSRQKIRMIPLEQIDDLSAVIITVPHQQFASLTPACFKRFLRPSAPIIDVPGIYSISNFARADLHVWQL
jgi:UDP-N-acetyl-D-glucosamine/UDP-N-acetyl-D-galactosamine dehydrogenase